MRSTSSTAPTWTSSSPSAPGSRRRCETAATAPQPSRSRSCASRRSPRGLSTSWRAGTGTRSTSCSTPATGSARRRLGRSRAPTASIGPTAAAGQPARAAEREAERQARQALKDAKEELRAAEREARDAEREAQRRRTEAEKAERDAAAARARAEDAAGAVGDAERRVEELRRR